MILSKIKERGVRMKREECSLYCPNSYKGYCKLTGKDCIYISKKCDKLSDKYKDNVYR